MITWYVAIKLGEWVIWSGIGTYFLIRTLVGRERPLWLYLSLFALLVTRDYVKRGRVALVPWRFGAAAVILAVALVCMMKA